MQDKRTAPRKKRILFVCIGNSCRSQMAEGFARTFLGDSCDVYSAGSRPAGFITLETIQVMREKGVDISGQYSKGLSEIPKGAYDAVVTMGCGDACPHIPGRIRQDWSIPDPIGCDISVYRQVRDLIEKKVHSLLALMTEAESDTSSDSGSG